MYYYLAIVTNKNMLRGNIVPSYILCKTNGNAPTRSPWRVVRPESVVGAMPKVLVTTLVGHEEMIDFLSCYRTRDKMHSKHKRNGKAAKKYYPVGALFWFPCDIYGYQRGPALFIKRVPDPKYTRAADQGFNRLKEFWNTKPLMSEVLSRDRTMYDIESSHVKPRLQQ